jgi:proteic killer suppression protein
MSGIFLSLHKNSSQNLRILKIIIIFAGETCSNMEIKFEKDYLRELFYNGVTKDKKHRYQPDIVRRYVRVVNILDSVDKTEDLYRYHALHYEALGGDKKGTESVRVNNQYRIEFKSSESEGITICNITELSNHYKK